MMYSSRIIIYIIIQSKIRGQFAADYSIWALYIQYKYSMSSLSESIHDILVKYNNISVWNEHLKGFTPS